MAETFVFKVCRVHTNNNCRQCGGASYRAFQNGNMSGYAQGFQDGLKQAGGLTSNSTK